MCKTIVQEAVINEVNKVIYYRVIVDGTLDASHTEQITFVLRYAHCSEENVWDTNYKERFLKFEDCEKKRGCDIAELLCKVSEGSGIDLQNCRGQGYDNWANMVGKYKGVQAIILEENPQAIISLCSVHSSNLCGVHAAESSVEVKCFFGIIQKLYKYYTHCLVPARWKILQELNCKCFFTKAVRHMLEC